MRLDGLYLDSQFPRRRRSFLYWLARLRRWLRRGDIYL